jgi:acyl CoA:acetate/3-ketoacid CoA transferase
MAGRLTIAEVDEVVPPGEIDPDAVHLPGIYVDRVLQLTPEQATDLPIEKRTVRTRRADASDEQSTRRADASDEHSTGRADASDEHSARSADLPEQAQNREKD